MSRPLQLDEVKIKRRKGSFTGAPLAAALGLFPVLVAVAASLREGGEWVRRLQIPADYQWVQGLLVLIGLAITFAAIAVMIEIRRWRVRNIIDELGTIDADIDSELLDLSRSVQRIRELSNPELPIERH